MKAIFFALICMFLLWGCDDDFKKKSSTDQKFTRIEIVDLKEPLKGKPESKIKKMMRDARERPRSGLKWDKY